MFALYRSFLSFLFAFTIIAITFSPAWCGYYMHKSSVVNTTTTGSNCIHHSYAIPPVSHPADVAQSHTWPSLLKDVSATDDGYKGILALAFGGSSILMDLLALISSSLVGLIIPAFFLGVAGIVFGAMKKKKNRALGRIGLILSIISTTAIALFVIAVFVALASFT